MVPMMTDEQFNTVGLILVAIITIIPTTLAAVYARRANTNSADALHEVKSNGGMSDPDPTLKDYVKYVGENAERTTRRVSAIEELLDKHIQHSNIMDDAIARVFLKIRPDHDDEDLEGFNRRH